MSCIPTFSSSPALAANGPSASAEVAAKAWRRVTRVFIVLPCVPPRSSQPLLRLAGSAGGHSEHGIKMYSSGIGRPMSEICFRDAGVDGRPVLIDTFLDGEL